MSSERLKPEQGERQVEILDFDKYGALYGRFLLASLPDAKIADIINPANATLTFDNMGLDALDERDYNPVCTESSIAERKEQWKDVEFSDAYSKWKTEFTSFMNNNKNSNHKSALGIIMGNPNEPVENFTESMAEKLFNTYCGDRSDIDSFVKTVARDLADNNGKIDPTKLQELLPHLQWIASGLFGKETASKVVTRLIELESTIFYNPGYTPQFTLDFFNHNKGRINTLGDDEKRILGLLYNSLVPEEKRIAPVTAVPAATVPTAVPKPAPIPEPAEEKNKQPSPPPAEIVPQPEEKSLQDMSLEELNGIIGEIFTRFPDKDQGPLYMRMMNMTEQQERDMTPEERNKFAGKPQEEKLRSRRMDLAILRKILEEEGLSNTQPQPAEKSVEEETLEGTEEIGEIFQFENEMIQWRHGNYRIEIEKLTNNLLVSLTAKDTTLNFKNVSKAGFDLASAIKDFKGIEPETAEKIYQALAKSFLNGLKANNPVCVALLKEMPYRTEVKDSDGKTLFLVDKSDESVSPPTFTYLYFDATYRRRSYVTFDLPPTLTEDEIKKLDPETIHSLNISIGKAVFETWIKNSPTPTAATGSVLESETDEEAFERRNRLSQTILERELANAQEYIGEPAGPTAERTDAGAEMTFNIEDMDIDDFRKRLNVIIHNHYLESPFAIKFSPNQVKKYITSMMGSGVKTGDITVDESGREITIHNFQIGKTLLVGGDKFNVTIGNREDGNGIEATWSGYRIGLFAGKTSERFQHLLNDIDFAVKENLNQDIDKNNSSWKAEKISIKDGKIRVEFEKTPEEELDVPSFLRRQTGSRRQGR